jgi:DNA-binding response OmpR family regulator
VAKILVIDDEFGIVEVIQAYLLKEGFEVNIAMNGKAGLELYRQIQPDLVILDLMLPDISGEDICKEIRLSSQVPIIMLTAKKEEADCLNGLSLGADDYLLKPFSPKVLMMRVHAILRRVYASEKTDRTLLKRFNQGDLVIDPNERLVIKKGQNLDVTKNEYELLLTFSENPNRTFTREQLIEATFGADYLGYDRTVDVHVKNLRRKIEDDMKEPIYIVTVYGVGYKFKGVRD